MFRLVGHSMSGVGVLDKAVVILAACVDGASLAELVDRTKLPRATAHRLAQALEIHRMLVRDTQGRWRPGPRLGELANAAPDVLLTAAEPLLAALRDATGESAQLYLRRADERICVASAERASGLRDTVPVGSVLPMVAGSAAQILLAWEPPEAVMPLPPRWKVTGRTLAEVRRRAGRGQCLGPHPRPHGPGHRLHLDKRPDRASGPPARRTPRDGRGARRATS